MSSERRSSGEGCYVNIQIETYTMESSLKGYGVCMLRLLVCTYKEGEPDLVLKSRSDDNHKT